MLGHRQRMMGYIVVDADGKAGLGLRGLEVIVYGDDAAGVVSLEPRP